MLHPFETGLPNPDCTTALARWGHGWYTQPMEVVFTRHARNRMRLYEIAEEDVRAALADPEQLISGAFDRR